MIYDDSNFFEAYKDMPRSSGLQYAGEWHQFKEMIPDSTDLTILDLGCGMGWHCKYLADQGAKHITGIDESKNMLKLAQKINNAEVIDYRLCSIQDFEFPSERYDMVISNLVLHYIEDLEEIYKKVFQTLKPGGYFLFNIEHPSFTAGIHQEWICDKDGKPLYWPMDNYYYPGIRETNFLGFEIKKYHHTLTQIINPLIQNGFTLISLEEAMPPKELMDIPGMKDEIRRPMMLLVKVQKN